MAAHDAGVEVRCPGCGETVLQKAMIPVLGEGGQGFSYLCPVCARALVVKTDLSGPSPGPSRRVPATAGMQVDEEAANDRGAGTQL